MAENTLKPAEIAQRYTVTTNTVRNWCKRYADHLSPGANPMQGGERVFTQRDSAVFAIVAKSLQEGMNHHEIGVRLAEITIGELETIVEPEQAATAALVASQPQELALAVSEHLAELERRYEARFVELESRQRDRLTVFFYGACVGLAAGLFLLIVAFLLVQMGSP